MDRYSHAWNLQLWSVLIENIITLFRMIHPISSPVKKIIEAENRGKYPALWKIADTQVAVFTILVCYVISDIHDNISAAMQNGMLIRPLKHFINVGLFSKPFLQHSIWDTFRWMAVLVYSACVSLMALAVCLWIGW